MSETSSFRIRRSLTISAALTLLAVLAGIALVGRAVQKHKHNALVVNIAGRQRMLVQQMTRDAMGSSLGHTDHRASIRTARELFERSFQRLLAGGEAPASEGVLPPTSDSTIVAQMVEVETRWVSFASILEQVASDGSDSVQVPNLLVASDTLTAALDSVVTLYQSNADRGVLELIRLLTGLAALCVATVVVSAPIRDWAIAKPLEGLAEAHAKGGALYRSMWDALAEGVVLQKSDGGIEACNESATKILGLSEDQMKGRKSTDPRWRAVREDGSTFPGEEHPAMVTLRTGVPCEQVVMGVHKPDGSITWISINCEPIYRDNDEAPYAVVSSFADITARRAAEAEQIRLVAAVNQSDDSFFTTDAAGVIEFVNPAFLKTTGYSRSEVLGKTPRILKSGKHTDEYYRELWATITAGKVFSSVVENRKKDGSLFTVRQSITPVTDRDGRVTHFTAIQRDITREIEIESRVNTSQRMEALGNLAGGIAHDFNNILTPICGFAELLRLEVPETGDAAECLLQIEQAAHRGGELASQILKYARGGTERVRQLDLEPLCREVTSLVRAALPSNVRMITEIDSDAPTILADPSHVHQIVMNLCVNAGQAMPDGGTLRLTVRPVQLADSGPGTEGGLTGEFAQISVADNGIGMDQATKSEVFEPFFTTKGSQGGTGLGLATVRSLVHHYGGDISLESSPGTGSTFTVFIPAAPDTEGLGEGTPDRTTPSGVGRIMVVDDEVAIATLAQAGLRSLGYDALSFSSSRDAVTAFNEAPGEFDLVVTDHAMPDLTGIQVAEQVHVTDRECPVILISGREAAAWDQSQFSAVLEKPFTLTQLALTIDRVLAE